MDTSNLNIGDFIVSKNSVYLIIYKDLVKIGLDANLENYKCLELEDLMSKTSNMRDWTIISFYGEDLIHSKMTIVPFESNDWKEIILKICEGTSMRNTLKFIDLLSKVLKREITIYSDYVYYGGLKTVDECLDAMNDLTSLYENFHDEEYIAKRNAVIRRLKYLSKTAKYKKMTDRSK